MATEFAAYKRGKREGRSEALRQAIEAKCPKCQRGEKLSRFKYSSHNGPVWYHPNEVIEPRTDYGYRCPAGPIHELVRREREEGNG